jgi:ABC-2 type transport system ATP-binding protein
MILETRELSFRYGDRQALRGVSLAVGEREIFGIVGPNGGGKTTLFKVLSTLVEAPEGAAFAFGLDLAREAARARRRLGVVFQSPSLDRKLTVRENLLHQGRLYGLRGDDLRHRVRSFLERFRLAERENDRVQTLSGGLARRVEVAKALLHGPDLLLLDEPSTGLDPRARIELWALLAELRASAGMSVVFTTHILQEAEPCDRVAILHRGELVAVGRPSELKASIDGDVISIEATDPKALADKIEARFRLPTRVLGGAIRMERTGGAAFVAELMESFPSEIAGVSLHRPTLDDVFLHKTGGSFKDGSVPEGRA